MTSWSVSSAMDEALYTITSVYTETLSTVQIVSMTNLVKR